MSLQYWKDKFLDIPSGPKLFEYEEVVTNKTERLDGVLLNWNGLKGTAEKLFVPPSMILLTVYAEVLAAWSHSESFTIVIPSWERLPLHPDINEVVGDFTAMSWLVVRRQTKSFAEKVRCYHEAVQEDLAHRAINGLKALRMVASKKRIKKIPTFPIVFHGIG